jgi:hypothetical protein
MDDPARREVMAGATSVVPCEEAEGARRTACVRNRKVGAPVQLVEVGAALSRKTQHYTKNPPPCETKGDEVLAERRSRGCYGKRNAITAALTQR